MINQNDIEVVYISPNNKIVRTSIAYNKNLTLKDLINHLIKKSIFSKDFLSKRYFGCYGKIINHKYIIHENDRIEIYDNLQMTPNEKRKFNFEMT